jgi:hypothetical protein
MNERKQQMLGQRVNKKKPMKERRNKGRKTPNASLGL